MTVTQWLRAIFRMPHEVVQHIENLQAAQKQVTDDLTRLEKRTKFLIHKFEHDPLKDLMANGKDKEC